MGNLLVLPVKKAAGLLHGIMSKLHLGGKVEDTSDSHAETTDAETTKPAAPPAPKTKTYSLYFKTGTKIFAGTDAKVWYEVKGNRDGSETTTGIVEPKQSKGMFEKGKEDKFEVTVPDLGTIVCICVGTDGKGSSPDWDLDSVRVECEGTVLEFSCPVECINQKCGHKAELTAATKKPVAASAASAEEK